MKKLTREEYYNWLKGQPDGKCLFCEWDTEQIIHKEFEHWVWIDNRAPYWDYYGIILPKRHFEEYGDMTFRESAELVSVIDYCTKKIVDAVPQLDFDANQIMFFWRNRFVRFDKEKKVVRPVHFHINVGPDKDGRFDVTIDSDAYKKDTSIFK